MTLTLRAYGPDDADAFRSLHRACLAHYKIAPATASQEARIIDLLNRERHMACHIAYDGDTALGFATWALSFPAGAGISLVMKELFVCAEARGLGVGRALLSALIGVARDEGCVRVDWATDGTNKTAQQFYAGLDAPALEKHSFRVERAAFDAFQKRLNTRLDDRN